MRQWPFILCGVLILFLSGSVRAATVTAQRGQTQALVSNAKEWSKTEVGAAYAAGTELKTGKRSYLEVSLDASNCFRIKSAAQVKVERLFDAAEDESGTVIRLVKLQVIDGEVSARLDNLPDDVRVKISSPTAVAGASGTGFTVSFSKATRVSLVKVIEDTVIVEALDRADKKVKVNALQQVVVISWKGGRIIATGHGVLSEKLLGKDFIEKFRQKPEQIQVVATATGPAPDDIAGRDERRVESEAAALDAARAALSAAVLQLAVDESTSVADLLDKDQALAAKVYTVIAAATATETAFGDDDSCTVTVGVGVKVLGEALGRELVGLIATVREIPKADYVRTFGDQAAITTNRAAVLDAQRRLARKLYGGVLEGGQTLEDAAKKDAQVRQTVTLTIRGAAVEKEHYYSDGSVAVVMSCPMDPIADRHPGLVGATYLSSPEPVVVHDFADYRLMRARGVQPVRDGKAKGGKGKTQGELAADLVKMLGLEGEMGPNATGAEYANFLAGFGVGPLGGWNPGGQVNDDVLAVLLVQILGLLPEVGNKGDVKDYLAVLREHNLVLGNVRAALNNMGNVQIVDRSKLASLYSQNLSSVRGR